MPSPSDTSVMQKFNERRAKYHCDTPRPEREISVRVATGARREDCTMSVRRLQCSIGITDTAS